MKHHSAYKPVIICNRKQGHYSDRRMCEMIILKIHYNPATSTFLSVVWQNPELRQFVQDIDIQDPLNPRDALCGGRTNATRLYCEEGNMRYVDVSYLYVLKYKQLAHWLRLRITPHSWPWNWAHGGCDRLTGDVYSPRHLSPPLVFPGVRVSLIFTVLWIVSFTWSGHWFWLRISSVYLIWRTGFDCEFFCLPNLDTLISTNGLCVWNRAHGGCDRSIADAYSS
jgi:hypothetical protein